MAEHYAGAISDNEAAMASNGRLLTIALWLVVTTVAIAGAVAILAHA